MEALKLPSNTVVEERLCALFSIPADTEYVELVIAVLLLLENENLYNGETGDIRAVCDIFRAMNADLIDQLNLEDPPC